MSFNVKRSVQVVACGGNVGETENAIISRKEIVLERKQSIDRNVVLVVGRSVKRIAEESESSCLVLIEKFLCGYRAEIRGAIVKRVVLERHFLERDRLMGA